MAVGAVGAYRLNDVESYADVVVQGEGGSAAVQHGIGRGGLLGIVHYRIRGLALEEVRDELPVVEVADCYLHLTA